jgi:hypothetical protein
VTALRALVSRLLGRGRDETGFNDEIAAHLALLAAEHERRGMTPDAARLAARREFGGVSQILTRSANCAETPGSRPPPW